MRDAVGNLLADGDQVTLIKDLDVKGAGQTLKRGTLIKSIRLTGDPQEIDCRTKVSGAGAARGVRAEALAADVRRLAPAPHARGRESIRHAGRSSLGLREGFGAGPAAARPLGAADDPIRILVDADACPVKDEIYRVAERRRCRSAWSATARSACPIGPLVERVVVSGGFDAADDWIAERADAAQRGDHRRHPPRRPLPQGRRHGARPQPASRSPSASIGGAIATRAIMADLRAGADGLMGGPAPFAKADRSRFLQALDGALVRLERG